MSDDALSRGIPRTAGIGEERNVHLLWGRRFVEWNAFLSAAGGFNIFGTPKYRLVWGWQDPEKYGLGSGEALEFFHLERWLDYRIYMDEDDWYTEESVKRKISRKYRVKPYPRHGVYEEIQTVSFERKAPGKPVQYLFLMPRLSYLEWRLAEDFRRLARTPEQISEEIAADNARKRELVRQGNNKILDDYGVREVIEDETKLLYRNPTLRKDPSLMLSPAVAYKKTRHRISGTL